MNKLWVITDLHIGHKMLVEAGYRPADYEDQIVRNWKRLVSPLDTVINLGDVWFGKRSEFYGFFDELPGDKILVRGNHDNESCLWYMRHGFAFACDGLKMESSSGPVYCTHEPVEWRPEGCSLNLHGHLHAGTHRQKPLKPHHLLLSLERDGYMPQLFDKAVRNAKRGSE